jgi:hypothetical protein
VPCPYGYKQVAAPVTRLRKLCRLLGESLAGKDWGWYVGDYEDLDLGYAAVDEELDAGGPRGRR